MTEIKRKGENTEERMEMAYEGARGYFRQGLNCAECVLKAFMEVYDTDLPAESVAMATGFGAGLGHTKEGVCGAISGAVMALGTVKGRRDPMEGEDMAERVAKLQQEIYPLFGDLVREIQAANNGCLLCKDLVAPFEDFNDKPRKKFCMQMIAECAKMAAKHADKE